MKSLILQLSLHVLVESNFHQVRIISTILFLCPILLILSCGKSGDLIDDSCGGNISTEILSANLDLGITSPNDFGGTISASHIHQDGLAYIIANKPKDKVFVVDLIKGEFVYEIPLDPNFIRSPSGIFVHNADSVFISDFNSPIIFLINSSGEMIDSYNLYRENLWEMPQEGFANFGIYTDFGSAFEYVSERKSFIIPLKQSDLWFFVKEKKDFAVIGEYVLAKKEFLRFYGKYEGIYASNNNYLLPFYLSHPNVEIVGDRLVLSFSMDPNLHIYTLEGEFVQTMCGDFSEYQIGELLEYNMADYDSKGLSDYNKRNSYFADFFYVKASNKYVRIYLECIKGADGFCTSKRTYALIFNENIDLEEVKLLDEDFGGNAFTYQAAFHDGFISKQSDFLSDDVFPANNFYKID